jgi:hypothetical protein
MPKRPQKRARAHHVLPQFYLRAWADSNDAVAMLTREGREIVTGTRVLAVEREFYTLTASDGRKDSTVETDFLPHWESRGAEVHRRLLAGDFPVDDEARTNFGLFLGLQWMRGRVARRVSEEFHDTMQKLLVRLGLDLDPLAESDTAEPDPGAPEFSFEDGSVEVPRLGHLPDEVKDVLRNQDAYKFPLPQEHTILQMVEGVPDAAEHFIDARWVLVRSAHRAFLTSDEPISLARTVTPQNSHFALGLSNAEFIQVPLSPALCLVFDRTDRNGPDLAFDAPASAVEEANQLTLQGLWQQLFRSPGSPPFPTSIPPLPDRLVDVR